MHSGYGLQFRSFVPTLMELLEDADGMVRDVAKSTVIELFRTGPGSARSDLKKQLKVYNVRPAIVSTIMGQLERSAPEPEPTVEENINPNVNAMPFQPADAKLDMPPPERKPERIDPAYVNTQRELDDTLRDMHPYFEGRESEQNWLKREQSCTKLRRLNAGNAPEEFRDAWVLGIKGLLDGILKAINSLRTSLSKEGCAVLQEIARTAGSGLDSMLETLLQNLIKLCGGTKKIASQAGDTTIDILISHVSYSTRILQHIWMACQDKNVQPRNYAAGWLKTLIKKEAHHKNYVEHTGGLDLIEKSIKKGLADANPGVRERMRGTFWAFYQVWPAKGDVIMTTLDPAQLKLLEKDPGNPNPAKKIEPVSRPALSTSKSSTAAPQKPSLRETMMAQRKAAMASKNLPARPGSAMSTFSSPAKTAGPSSNSTFSSSTSSTSRPPAAASASSHKGLSVAPMRPTKPRPKEVQRPATAGPYSVRQASTSSASSREQSGNREPSGHHVGSSTSTTAPSRPKARPMSTAIPSPKRASSKPPSNHSLNASQSSSSSPRRDRHAAPRAVPSPKVASPPDSPARSVPSDADRHSSPTKPDEDFTMVMPNLSDLSGRPAAPALAGSPVLKESRSTTPAKLDSPVSKEQGLSTPAMSNLAGIQENHKTPAEQVKIYEDPHSATGNEAASPPSFTIPTVPVLGEVPVNKEHHHVARADVNGDEAKASVQSPERLRRYSRLVDSGITRMKAKSLDAHGLKALQGVVNDKETGLSNERFDALLVALFEYLGEPLNSLEAKKVGDVKVQNLCTINAMLGRNRKAFAPHIAKGICSILSARSLCDTRWRITTVGLNSLVRDLIAIGNPSEVLDIVTTRLQSESEKETAVHYDTIRMGFEMLRALLDNAETFVPEEQIKDIGQLAVPYLTVTDTEVRKAAANVYVALHTRADEKLFWSMLETPSQRNLLTYIIKKEQEVKRV